MPKKKKAPKNGNAGAWKRYQAMSKRGKKAREIAAFYGVTRQAVEKAIGRAYDSKLLGVPNE